MIFARKVFDEFCLKVINTKLVRDFKMKSAQDKIHVRSPTLTNQPTHGFKLHEKKMLHSNRIL